MAKYDLTISGSLEEIQAAFAKLTGSNVTITTGPAVNTGITPPLSTQPGITTFNPPLQSTAPVNTAPAPTAGAPATVDADGLPWDKRIHSSSQKINNDGRWARKKNVNPTFFDQVANELRGANNAAPASQPQYNAPPVAFNPPALPPQNTQAPVVGQPVYTPPVAQPQYNAPPVNTAPAPQPQPPQAVQGGATMTDLFNKIQNMVATGTADQNYIVSLTNRLGQRYGVTITSINDIAPHANMIADAFAFIAADGK